MSKSSNKHKTDKTYRMGFLMDPLQSILPDKDTTFVMMLEAQKRGHEVLYFTQEDLLIDQGAPIATMHKVKLMRPEKAGQPHFKHLKSNREPLGNLDIVFMRQDPPFTLNYVYLTQFLDLVPRPTVVVNRPSGLRAANEKLFALHFPEFIPQSMVTQRIDELMEFLDRVNGKMVVKPLDLMGGYKVFVVDRKDVNKRVILESITELESKWVLAQAYLPAARKGDKRIIMLAGEPIGWTLRTPQPGDHRSNIHVGGVCVRTNLTEKERKICQTIGPWLRREGLHLVGLDVIGGYVTEINVTSPTGVQEINRLEGVNLENRIMDFMEWLVQSAKQE